MSEHGPFDGVELKQWAEMYGHPEEWAKRAQAAHNRAEQLAIRLGQINEIANHYDFDSQPDMATIHKLSRRTA